MPTETREQRDIAKAVTVCLKQIIEDKDFTINLAQQVSSQVLTKIDERLSNFEEKFIGYEKVIEEKFVHQESKIKKLQQEVDLLSYRNELLQQHSCRNGLRIYGIKEDTDVGNCKLEDVLIKTINNKLNLNIQSTDIEYCYRLGKKDPKKSRPIIVNMSNHKTKQKILKQKKLLKNSGISIWEELTNTRVNIMKKAVQIYGRNKVWTREGNVYVKNGSNIRHIKSENELYEARAPEENVNKS